MADKADQAHDSESRIHEKNIEYVRKISDIPEGKQGDCDLCGVWSGRLILGCCAPCRDKYNLD